MSEPSYMKRLRYIAPSIALSVSREIDEDEEWDGDGPDPQEEGYLPYCIEVTASTVIGGYLKEGFASLCSSYYQPDEPIGEAHGYLPQMVDEALSRLELPIREQPHLRAEVKKARDYMKRLMRKLYDDQRKEFAHGA
jgi:hypothetical protein